jgi:hypothetical protein
MFLRNVDIHQQDGISSQPKTSKSESSYFISPDKKIKKAGYTSGKTRKISVLLNSTVASKTKERLYIQNLIAGFVS